MSKFRWVALPLWATFSAAAAGQPEAVLEVAVSGIERAEGAILVAACGRAEFLSHDCKYGGQAPAQLGLVVVKIGGVPDGVYAILVLHDLDGDGVLKRTAFGLPAEPVGFGNNAPIKWGPPSFDDSAVTVSGRTATAVTLRNR